MNSKEKIKERVVPRYKRCCCCLPLRYGLITWGYFKIIFDICFIPIMAYYLMVFKFMIGMFEHPGHKSWIVFYFSLFILAVVTFMTDIIMSIVFIVGGHQKRVKLLRPFYIYSIVLLVLSILMIATSIYPLINSIGNETALHTWEIHMIFTAYFVIIAVQLYFILLLRSEIIKLRNNAESLRFVNNAEHGTEAECTIVYEEKLYPSLPSPDTETEDV